MSDGPVTIAYLWDMGSYWQCRFCRRSWRKKEPLSSANRQYLSEHVGDHLGRPRKRASDIPALRVLLDDDLAQEA